MKKIRERGVTLIVIIITIIVLLILASVTISLLTGDNGIIKNANESKMQAEIAQEYEILNTSEAQARLRDTFSNLKEENFIKVLNNTIGKGKFKLQYINEEFFVTFSASDRTYNVDKNGNVTLIDNNDIIVADETPGDYTNKNTLDGSEEKPFEIASIEDLVKFANDGTGNHNLFKGKKVILTRDLDFKSKSSYGDSSNTTLFEDYNKDNKKEGIMEELTKESERGFKSIEDFRGTFDGQNHTIKNLYINNTEESYLGFFDDIDEDTIVRNLTVEGRILFATDENTAFKPGTNRIGGIVGRITGSESAEKFGTIENCVSKVNIEVKIKKLTTDSSGATFYVGGVAGKSAGTILNTENYGKVNYTATKSEEYTESPEDKIGGIAGTDVHSNILKINNCANFGDVEVKACDRIKVGGIAGDASYQSKTETIYTVENVYNKAKVKATMDATSQDNALRIGGIVGDNSGPIKQCYNIGEVEIGEGKSTKYKGYIVGDYIDGQDIKDCKYKQINSSIKGAQDKEDSTHGITSSTTFSEEDVKKLMNENVKTHNQSSEDKWNEW